MGLVGYHSDFDDACYDEGDDVRIDDSVIDGIRWVHDVVVVVVAAEEDEEEVASLWKETMPFEDHYLDHSCDGLPSFPLRS
jgi:hypothetical protein